VRAVPKSRWILTIVSTNWNSYVHFVIELFSTDFKLKGKGDVQSFKHVKVYVYEFWGFCCDECSDCGPLCCDTV